ncbi:hypothetical protein BGX38DRAFT_360005 [Terfezia claveryi]|nr:hypothetical protein BGX38DRAFT_360005 [Terfezia claveryi]
MGINKQKLRQTKQRPMREQGAMAPPNSHGCGMARLQGIPLPAGCTPANGQCGAAGGGRRWGDTEEDRKKLRTKTLNPCNCFANWVQRLYMYKHPLFPNCNFCISEVMGKEINPEQISTTAVSLLTSDPCHTHPKSYKMETCMQDFFFFFKKKYLLLLCGPVRAMRNCMQDGFKSTHGVCFSLLVTVQRELVFQVMWG